MTMRRKVIGAVDGGTIKVRNKVKGSNYIRIAGFNSPEKGEKGYATYKVKLNKFKGKVVTIVPKGRSYNRIVADVRYKRKKIG